MADDDKWLRDALNRPERDAELMKTGVEIALHPLTGYSTGTLPENTVMLVIEFLTGPPEMQARVLRLAMKRPQCTELAQALDRLARAPHVLPPEKLN